MPNRPGRPAPPARWIPPPPQRKSAHAGPSQAWTGGYEKPRRAGEPVTAPISPTGAQVSPNPTMSSSGAADNTQLSSQAFLQLLVAQLQYQDPSSPVDTSSFMN